MLDPRFEFVDVVVADRHLVVTRFDDHTCRLEPQAAELAWFCDLDDGTSTDSERDPASYVRWVCPALRLRRAPTDPPAAEVTVRRSGPQSDLGRLMKRFGRLAGRTSEDSDEPYVYTDPAGVLDVALRHRIENWPTAVHGDLVVRPAELSSIAVTREGLVVESVSWWGSAPALDHQIGLAVDIARRLAGDVQPRS